MSHLKCFLKILWLWNCVARGPLLPTTDETFVHWDGNGLVVKQAEAMRGDAVGSIPSEELRTDVFLILSKPSLMGLLKNPAMGAGACPSSCMPPYRPHPE